MWLPRTIGGAELAPLEFLEVVEELSRQDGSVGWCTTIAAGSARLAGALEEDAARTVFGAGEGVLVGALYPAGKAVAVIRRLPRLRPMELRQLHRLRGLGRERLPHRGRGTAPIPVSPIGGGGDRRLGRHRTARDREQRLSGQGPVRAGAAHDPARGLPAAAAPGRATLRDTHDQRVLQQHRDGGDGNRAGSDRRRWWRWLLPSDRQARSLRCATTPWCRSTLPTPRRCWARRGLICSRSSQACGGTQSLAARSPSVIGPR